MAGSIVYLDANRAERRKAQKQLNSKTYAKRTWKEIQRAQGAPFKNGDLHYRPGRIENVTKCNVTAPSGLSKKANFMRYLAAIVTFVSKIAKGLGRSGSTMN